MPVTLKDAKITVKLDMADAEKQVESLEKKTKKARATAKKAKKKKQQIIPGSVRVGPNTYRAPNGTLYGLKEGGIDSRFKRARWQASGLYSSVKGGAAWVLGMAAFMELLLPMIMAAITEAAPEWVKKTGIPKWLREATNDLVDAVITKRLSEIKAAFGAVDDAKDIARAQSILGEPVTAKGVFGDLELEFETRMALQLAERSRNKVTRGLIGEAIGKWVSSLWR